MVIDRSAFDEAGYDSNFQIYVFLYSLINPFDFKTPLHLRELCFSTM